MDLEKLLNRKSPKKRPASKGPPARKKPAVSQPPVEVIDLLDDDLLLASNDQMQKIAQVAFNVVIQNHPNVFI